MKTSFSLREAAESVADLFFPRSCAVCGRDLLKSERYLCLACLMDFPYTAYARFSRNPMADRLNALFEEGPYMYAVALFHYRGDYRKTTPALKYGGNVGLGRYLAGMLGRELSASGFLGDVDCIVPVPLHWSRRWSRGYNQAEIIAKALLPFFPKAKLRTDILFRRRRTKSQTGRRGLGKSSNVNDAFRAFSPREKPSHILLVDDVFTSGNTVAACIKAIRKVIPDTGVRISVATLAFAGE